MNQHNHLLEIINDILFVILIVGCIFGYLKLNDYFLSTFRKYIVLVIFVVAAFLTPPDVFSQCLMALPMLILYELGIIVVKIFGKKE